MSQQITILAIDRAEPQLRAAIDSFKNHLDADVECYLLINEDFRNSPAYYGNECPDLFQEIVIDFKNTDLLEQKITQICGDTQVVTHCRMEEAIKDFELLIPLIPNSFNQSVQSLEICTQKSKMRDAMIKKYPEITPRHISISDENQIDKIVLAGLNYPVIVKPNGLHSSYLVSKCTSFEELEVVIKNIFPEMKKVYNREYGTGGVSVVIEEFLEGKMYSVDVYINNEGEVFFLPFVSVVTSADVGKDGFYGYEFLLPSDLNDSDKLLANQCVSKCIDSVNLKNSVAHIELFNTSDGWKIIEIGPRIGGYRHDMYQQAYGIDHFLNDLLIHAGKNPLIEPVVNRYSACINIYTEKEGVISSINGVNEAKSVSSIVQFGVYAKVGDQAVFASNGGKMVADATFGNDNIEELEHDVETVRKNLQFTVE